MGIYISEQGKLTLGEDEGGIPSTFSPIVEGLTYGIQKEINDNTEQVYDEKTEKYYYPEGVFNFYDGKVIGGTAAFLLQRVNDTPTMYDPTVVTNTETKKQESTLEIVSGIEAVIGKKRYILLEEAIADANKVIGDSNTQVEITIVRDIVKDADHKVVVDNTKNIKLDLNGYVFTTTANDYVLENYGKLEIYDSSETVNEETGEFIVGTGKITGSTNSTILNGIPSEAIGDVTYEDIDLKNATASGDYFFEALTGKEGVYEVVTNATISSEGSTSSYFDCGYITVRKDNQIVNHDDINGRKVYIAGEIEDKDYKFNLVGGTKYYIQFGYRKDSSTNSGSDCFIIKNMKIGKVGTIGELKITSGTYECTKQGTNSFSEYLAAIQNESKLYVNGGEINAYYNSVLNRGLAKINDGNLYFSNATCVWSDGQLYILGDNVNIKGSNSGVCTENGGNTMVNTGTIYGTSYGIRNYSNNSTTIINGGNVSAGSYAIRNDNAGKIQIENVTITLASYDVYNHYNGVIEINNINMTSVNSSGVPTVNTGLYNYDDGKIIFNDGNIYVNNCSGCNRVRGTIEMNGGTLETYCNSVTIYNGDYNDVSTFKMTGGTVESRATNYPAIWNNDTESMVIIGSNDGNVITERPVIKSAGTSAVNNRLGTFNFYDGILTGGTYATSGTVTKTPEMFKVLYSADGTVGILGIEAPFAQIATVNGSYYDSLASAIEAATKINGKVELCKDVIITTDITIPAESTVTIDLLGFSINGYTESGILFTNNGTLTIGKNDGTVYTNAPKIIGKTIAIENNGDLYLADGQIGISDGELDTFL